MSDGNDGAKVVTPGQGVRGHDGIYVPSKTTGSASTLPMTEEEMAAAALKEQTRKIGFAP